MEVTSIFYNAAKVIIFSEFHVAEVAYDFVLQLKTWILSKGMLNSFDSWHGTQYTLVFFGSFCLDDYDYFLKVSILLVLIFFCLFSGAKSVTKAMKEVASGAQRDEGSKWFFELLDKGKISLL